MTHNLFEDCAQYTVQDFADRSRWLEGRKSGIGGSDAAALADSSRFKTLQELWMDKVQGIRNFVGGPNVEYGRTCEPALRTLYQAKHLDQIVQHREDCTLISTRYDWQKYSPDGLIFEPKTGRKGILEIKTAQIQNAKKAKEWRDGVPIEYYLQVLHGLIVTGFDFVTFTAELRYWDGRVEIIERSYTREAVIADMEELDRIEHLNWGKYFETGVMPPLTIAL